MEYCERLRVWCGRGERAAEPRQDSCWPPRAFSAALDRKSSRTQFPNLFLTLELKPAQEGGRRGGGAKAPWERHQTEWKHLWPPGHKPLRTNAALAASPPWAPVLEANPEWFRKSPGPGAGAGRKGAIKGEREKWGFLGNEHIWKQGRKGAGSCSHKTIWQLCVSLREGLWKLWGSQALPPGDFLRAAMSCKRKLYLGPGVCPSVWAQFGTENLTLPCRGHRFLLCCEAWRLPWLQAAWHTGFALPAPGICQTLTPAWGSVYTDSQHLAVDAEICRGSPALCK